MDKDKSSHLPWFRKYAPAKSADILGQEKAMSEIKKFLQDYKKQKKKAILLHGPTGTGKTASVYAVASDLDCEVVEVNASDFRNEASINSIVGAAVEQLSLFAKTKLILVDEIDGLSGTQDRGGIPALAKLIDKTTYPIFLTTNDAYNQKFRPLRAKCIDVEFHALQAASIQNIIRPIAKSEGIGISEENIKALARMASGDARAAINDLQTLAGFSNEVKEPEVLGERNRQDTIINALLRVMKSTDVNVARNAFENVNEDLDQCMLWLDENLPKEYTKPEDLAKAYDMMSRADVFRGRIRKWQHWRFLVYVNELITAGIALSKKEKYHQFVAYKPTTKLLKIWMANQRYLKRKEIAGKIAEKTHTSTRVAVQSTIPYLQHIFRKNKQRSQEIAEFLGLEKEHIDWLRNK